MGRSRHRAPSRRGWALLALVAVATLLPAGELRAHTGGDAQAVTVLERVEPALPGVEITVRTTLASQIFATNPTPTELAVLDDRGRPFLRLSSAGVLADVNSPGWYVTNGPAGSTPVPERVRRGAPPDWQKVSRHSSWAWFDHRLHPSTVQVPPEVREGREVATLARWTVPFRYGDQPVEAVGRVEFRPLLGQFVPRLTSPAEPLPGLKVSVIPSRAPVPGMFLQNDTGQTVVVLGRDGEPFARLGPEVEVNIRSPFFVDNLRAREETPEAEPDAAAPPEWRRVQASPRYAWLELRAQYPRPEPPRAAVESTEPTPLLEWSVPLQLADRRLEVTGVTDYVPIPEPPGRRSIVGFPLLAALSALASVGVVVGMRRRHGPPRSTAKGSGRAASGGSPGGGPPAPGRGGRPGRSSRQTAPTRRR